MVIMDVKTIFAKLYLKYKNYNVMYLCIIKKIKHKLLIIL